MKTSTVLRCCLVTEWVVILIYVASASVLESLLPEPLGVWLKTEAENKATIHDLALCAVYILVVSMIVASAGLLCLRRWAARLCLITWVMFLMPFDGPTVAHALAGMLGEIATLMSGMVIALAFFTDSLKENVAEHNTHTPSVGRCAIVRNGRVKVSRKGVLFLLAWSLR